MAEAARIREGLVNLLKKHKKQGENQMSKIVNIKIQTEKKEKIQKIFNSIEEIKDTLADMISEFDEENTTEEQTLDALTEALDALEDASEVIADVL